MPTYTYKCTQCHEIFDRVLRLEHYQDLQASPCCNQVSHKIFLPTAIRGDYEAYSCPITGKTIRGRREHEENLARHGCRVLEKGEVDGAKREAARREAELDKGVDETVERFYEALPSDKREALASAVINGVDLAVERL